MFPIKHLIFGLIFSIILLLVFPQITILGFLIIFISAVLIDIDHYLYYIYKKKDFNLKKSYNWFVNNGKKFLSLSKKQRNKSYLGFCFLHGVEILSLFFILGIFISRYFFFIFIGFAFHLILDFIIEIVYFGRTDKIALIYSFWRGRKSKFIDSV